MSQRTSRQINSCPTPCFRLARKRYKDVSRLQIPGPAMLYAAAQTSAVQVLARRGAGTVLMGLGVHLAFQKT